jgi:DNA helicase-2/ATP-dependent DNA helicase PcrA
MSGTSLRDRLLGFLERISLVSDTDGLAEGEGSVTLMTLHAAKGLEFPAVAIIGVEDGLLPHANASRDTAGVEEERRLCFVGITRARRFLLLTHARFRTVFGEVSPTIPSRFLKELDGPEVEHEEPPDPASLDLQSFTRAGSDGPDAWAAQREAARSKALEYPPGSMVRHAIFGMGRVLSVQAVGAQSRAMVRFDAGVKNLVLEYAKLERVGP